MAEELELAKNQITALQQENERLRRRVQLLASAERELDMLLGNLPVRTFLVSAGGILLETKGMKSYPRVNADMPEPSPGENMMHRMGRSADVLKGYQEAAKGEFFQHTLSFGNRHFEFYYNPFIDMETGEHQVHITGFEITRMVRPQQELNRYKLLAEKAFETGKLGFWERDLTEFNIQWSQSVYKIFGADPKTFDPAVQGLKLVKTEVQDHIKALTEKGLASKEPYSYILETNNVETGAELVVQVFVDMDTDENGTPVRLFGIVQNITEARNRERALKESGERMNKLLESIANPFFAFDFDSRLTFINLPARSLLQLPVQVPVTDPDIQAAFAEHMAGPTGIRMKAAIAAGTFVFEQYSERLNNWYEVRAFPGPEGYSVMINNITARKQLEVTLTRLNESKNRFFSIIAHDLRSPLSSIMGLTDLAVSHTKNHDSQKLERSLNHIDSAVRNAYKLLDNLLQWSRLQMDDIKALPGLYSLHEAVLFNTELLAFKAREKNISVYNHIPADLLYFADKDMVDTVFRNLLSNALKFTYPSGRVTINATKQHNTLSITVSDTGTGMETLHLEKLFSLDSKYSHPGTAGETGTGMGLKLCRDLLHKTGGTIAATSQPGKGSTFTVTLPARPPARKREK